MYCPSPEKDPYWFWGQRDLRVKGQGQICTLKFPSFPHDNAISFWYKVMILNTCVYHDPRRTSIDFGIKRFKVKVKLGLQIVYRFCTITLFPSDIQLWYFTSELIMTQGRLLLILKSRGQRSRSYSDFELCTVSGQWLLSFDIWWWYLMHVLPVTRGTSLFIRDQEVKGQGQIKCLNFTSFSSSKYYLLTVNSVLHTRLYCQWPEVDSKWFVVKRSRSNFESLNLLPRGGGVRPGLVWLKFSVIVCLCDMSMVSKWAT